MEYDQKNVIGRFCLDNRYIIVLYLAFLVSLFLFQNYCFIKWDAGSIFADLQVVRSWRFYQFLFSGEYRNYGNVNNQYPPLVYIVSALYYKLFGFSGEIARFSLSIFSVIFILSMYGIGKELGGRLGGVCVSALAAGSPHIVNYAHRYYLDFPQTAMTALVFYLLLLSNGYRKTGYSWILGITLGLAIMTKWSALFYLFLPIIWFILPIDLGQVLRKNGKKVTKTTFYAGEGPNSIGDADSAGRAGISPIILRTFMPWAILGFMGGLLYFIWARTEPIFLICRANEYWQNWHKLYFWNIFLPCLVFLAVTFLMEMWLKKKEKWQELGMKDNIAKTDPLESKRMANSYTTAEKSPEIVFPGTSAGELVIEESGRGDNLPLNNQFNGTIRALNFARVIVTALTISGTWFYMSMPAILDKIKGDIQWPREPQQILNYLIYALKIQYNFSSILMLIGLIFIFAIRKDLWTKLILPIALTMSFILMAKVGFAFMRYVLSFVIFSSALGGYWVGYMGRLRKPIALLIVSVSLFSMLGWFTSPNYDNIILTVHHGLIPMELSRSPYSFTFKILRSSPPIPTLFDISPVIAKLEKDPNGGERTAFLLIDLKTPSSNFPVTAEDFRVDSIIAKKPYNFIELIHKEDLFRQMRERAGNNNLREKIDSFVIISPKCTEISDLIEKISLYYFGFNRELYSWDRPDDLKLYLLRFNRKIR